MVRGKGGVDWSAMLDRLSACITPQEDEAVRRLGRDTTIPAPLLEVRMHNLVALLLVNHGIARWPQLHASFPGYGEEASVASEGAHGGAKECQTPKGDDQKTGKGKRASQITRRPPANNSAGGAGGQKRKAGGQPSGSPRPAKRRSTRSGREQPRDPSFEGESDSDDEAATLADYPRIISWWHPTKNGTKLPHHYRRGTNQRVWLQCPGCPSCKEVHQWNPTANDLSKIDGEFVCPACTAPSGRSICSCRSILANALWAKEWHESNPPPATVALGSHKTYKWRCAKPSCGQVWEAEPHRRGKGGSSCPKCSRRKGKQPSLAEGYPGLAREWDKKKNTIPLTKVSCGSNKRVWWRCEDCSFSWQAVVKERALKATGTCPRCRRK